MEGENPQKTSGQVEEAILLSLEMVVAILKGQWEHYQRFARNQQQFSLPREIQRFPEKENSRESGNLLLRDCFPLPATAPFSFFKIYLFMAVLGLRFCVRAFSSWGGRGLLLSWCAGLSLSRPLLLWSTGSRRAGSVVVAHGPSCSAACGIFPDQGSNPFLLHWQADSQPLCHQGSPAPFSLSKNY